MTRHFAPPPRETMPLASILIDAARCWREARDAGHPIQPRLSRMLILHDCTILAPVLDSLIRFYEIVLGRPISTGRSIMLSEDERLLLALIDGSQHRKSTDGMVTAFACALGSTRIMMMMATEPERPSSDTRRCAVKRDAGQCAGIAGAPDHGRIDDTDQRHPAKLAIMGEPAFQRSAPR